MHVTHTKRNICGVSLLCSALHANSLAFRIFYCVGIAPTTVLKQARPVPTPTAHLDQRPEVGAHAQRAFIRNCLRAHHTTHTTPHTLHFCSRCTTRDSGHGVCVQLHSYAKLIGYDVPLAGTCPGYCRGRGRCSRPGRAVQGVKVSHGGVG